MNVYVNKSTFNEDGFVFLLKSQSVVNSNLRARLEFCSIADKYQKICK